jgi:hypothetical protein
VKQICKLTLAFAMALPFMLLLFGNVIVLKPSQSVTHYQVDETLNYAAWYFVDTLQDDLRNQFQR